ncbi:putative molybdopterin converting factor [Listeria monocytogenes]|nr:putative molybdopterin converting factor [Listeria monocytogenes]GAT39505.1 putative molybdopterin converting factor [Listeria monocytogenes]
MTTATSVICKSPSRWTITTSAPHFVSTSTANLFSSLSAISSYDV